MIVGDEVLERLDDILQITSVSTVTNEVCRWEGMASQLFFESCLKDTLYSLVD